jgi:hypothetical protein
MADGYIACPAPGDFAHRFGGQSWRSIDPLQVDAGPALILVLDLRDPRLRGLGMGGMAELPLASYISNSIWTGDQRYQILADKKELLLESRSVASAESLDAKYRLPQPLPERSLVLRDMRPDEDPSQVGHLPASDTFLGGGSFIRVMGPPIWLEQTLEVRCSCAADMTYAASIGYEVASDTLLDEPFFIGEGALYFFVCCACRRLAVRSQSS